MSTSNSEIYKNGAKAYKLGEPRKVNPYSSRSEKWDKWNDGWESGFRAAHFARRVTDNFMRAAA